MVYYIVVTGGVISGLGKGITISSIGLLFKSLGYRVTTVKIDPYYNYDSGLLSPFEHGECFVLSDGTETDLDLGNYERFLNIKLSRANSITQGYINRKIYLKERKGYYKGKTVQVVPHVTNEVSKRIKKASKGFDICMIELGGTIGDIEVQPFLESLKKHRNYYFIHVCPIMKNMDEVKTKPIQHSVKYLNDGGIKPNMLIVRSDTYLNEDIIQKVKTSCNVKHVLNNINVDDIYFVPDILKKQNIIEIISKKLKFEIGPYNLFNYHSIIDNLKTINNVNTEELKNNVNTEEVKTINLLIAGKYIKNEKSVDTYISLVRAIKHASVKLNIEVNIVWFDTKEEYDDLELLKIFNNIDCIIIPGGFDSSGINIKLKVAQFARIHDIPILGICLGMHIMVSECCNLTENKYLTSREWTKDKDTNKKYLIDLIPDQNNVLGGTMKLGEYKTTIEKGSKTFEIYKSEIIYERHRHRYEVINCDQLEKSDLNIVGRGENIDIVEDPTLKFNIGCQFHPEFISSFNKPHPLFISLLENSIK